MEEEVRINQRSSPNYELPPLQKKFILFRIPPVMRFSLIWIIFFSVIGVVLQSFANKIFIFPDSITKFFGINFVNFINLFSNFTTVTTYESTMTLVYSILGKWYYFFYAGGLLAFLWSIISWIIHLELSFNKRMRIQKQTEQQRYSSMQQIPQMQKESYFETLLRQQTEQENKTKSEIQQTETRTTEKKQITEKTQRINPPIEENTRQTDNNLPINYFSASIKENQNERIEQWLQVGLLLLSQDNIEEAKMVYSSIKQEYDFSQDPYQELYGRIKSFYEALVQARKEQK